jgi:pyridoxal phosphate enzyme (YggS family)
MDVASNIEVVRGRIAAAASRAGRDPAQVRLIGVVKSVRPEVVAAAIRCGLTDLGENFVQEAEERRAALGSLGSAATWHFIGHLQTNKTAAAIRLSDIIHSVDSLRLAQTLSRRAERDLPVLLEVNVGREASKYGFLPEEVDAAVRQIGCLPHLQLRGLMTIAPAVADAEQVRPLFRELHALAAAHGLAELSMGMTDDFEVAVEEGATMVRVGRALFGERPS